MAFSKTATATILYPTTSLDLWRSDTSRGRAKAASRTQADIPTNLVDQAGEIFEASFDPSRYLLTHATIVCSVDTFEVPNVKLGSTYEGGFKINRKYADFRIAPQCEKYINNNCFVPGTPITMFDGTVKPIEEVEVGDQVLTHLGRPRKVLETFKHDSKGVLLEIQVRGSNERLLVTKDHPFFTFQANDECVACGGPIERKLKAISHLLGKFYCSKGCYYGHKVTNATLLEGKGGTFAPACDLRDVDFSATPVVDEVVETGLTKGQARLIGLFAAEGYYEQDSRNGNRRVGVCWAFHANETDTLAKSVQDLMLSEFGVECVVRSHSSDNGIHVTSKVNPGAVDFFSKWVQGEGSKSKSLHGDLLRAEVDVQREVLRGWFEGDGSAFDTAKEGVRGDFRLTGASASQSLAYQMRTLLHRLGIAPRMSNVVLEGRQRIPSDQGARVAQIVPDPSKQTECWALSVGACWLGDLVQETVYEDVFVEAEIKRGGFQGAPNLRFLNGFCLNKFQSVQEVDYEGPVYNFETEEDHSYIAAGVAVHNSDAWSRPVIKRSFQTFRGGYNFVEHVQIVEQAKGRIIDAVARDIGESVYIDILIATDRKHTELVKEIESGKMATLSMGCTVDFTICTKCGHVAADETELCPHIKYEKGQAFFDELGKQHRVAELCFPPGSRLVMGDGSRCPIEDVQVGDLVLSHTGHRREVVQTFERRHAGQMVALDVTGLPQTLRSTPNHPYWVLSPRGECACGCGSLLSPNRQNGERRDFVRSYVPGHHPNGKGVCSLSAPNFQFKEAADIQVGDMVALPVPTGVVVPKDVDEDRAWLLGWFLAEGSFLKRKGQRIGVQFTLNAEDEGGIAEQIASVLQSAFSPESDRRFASGEAVLEVLGQAPVTSTELGLALGRKGRHLHGILKRLLQGGLVTRRPLRSDEKVSRGLRKKGLLYLWSRVPDCGQARDKVPHVYCYDRSEGGRKLVVCYSHEQAAKWFYRHSGEYAEGKRLSSDAIFWPVELQQALLKGYVNGDGGSDLQERFSVCSISETLISQMQIVSARCGFWTRRQVTFGGQATELMAVVGGENLPLDDRGWRPLHSLHFQPSTEVTAAFTGEGGRTRGVAPAWRSQAGCLLYRVRGKSSDLYDGPVYNISVETDHSYLVEGVAVHNCGHGTVDPTGGVTFIEASWVETPAFTGAVLRNILEPQGTMGDLAHKLAMILSEVPGKWTQDGARMKAASIVAGLFDEPEEDAEEAPAEDAEKTKQDRLKDLEDQVYEDVVNKVKQRVRKDLEPESPGANAEPSTSSNDNLNKYGSRCKTAQEYVQGLKGLCRTASCSADLLNKVALFNRAQGVEYPVHLYRVALAVGGVDPTDPEQYMAWTRKVRQAAGTITKPQFRALLGLSRLLDRRASVNSNGT